MQKYIIIVIILIIIIYIYIKYFRVHIEVSNSNDFQKEHLDKYPNADILENSDKIDAKLLVKDPAVLNEIPFKIKKFEEDFIREPLLLQEKLKIQEDSVENVIFPKQEVPDVVIMTDYNAKCFNKEVLAELKEKTRSTKIQLDADATTRTSVFDNRENSTSNIFE
jgi:hypothetical protein